MPKSTISILGIEAVPANFGNWSGPGYAGGRIIKTSQDPQGALFQDLYFGPKTDAGTRDAAKRVLARGYFDAGPRNHDLGYEYAERMYGKGMANASPASQNLVQYAADLDLLGNVLKYRSDTYRYIGNAPESDFVTRQYQKMLVFAFDYQAVWTYHLGPQMHLYWKQNFAGSPSGIAEPSVSDAFNFVRNGLPALWEAQHWGTLLRKGQGLELLSTSDFLTDAEREANLGLTHQEMLLFNQHFVRDATKAPTWPMTAQGGSQNPLGFWEPFDDKVVMPRYDRGNRQFVFDGTLNGSQVRMVLSDVNDVDSENYRTFTYTVFDAAGQKTEEKVWKPVADTFNEDNASRAYTYARTIWSLVDGTWTPAVVETVAIARPALPDIDANASFTDWRAVIENATWIGRAATATDPDAALFDSILYGGPGAPTGFKAVDIASRKAKDLVADATGGDPAKALATRFALIHLEPFLRQGGDFAAANAEGGLDLHDAATGQGGLTRQYLADRAAFLQAVMDPKSNTDAGWFSIATNTLRSILTGSLEPTMSAMASNANFMDVGYANFQVGADNTRNKYAFGADAADSLAGGSGDSHLYGGGGADTLVGHAGRDYLQGDAGDDSLDGGGGNDVLSGGRGADILDGGEGDDTLDGGTGVDIIYGGDGNDRIYLGGGNTTAYGDAGADEFYVCGPGEFHLADADPAAGDRIFALKGAALPAGADPYARGAYQEIAGAFVKQEGGGNVWTSPLGNITITQNSPTTITTANGLTLVIDSFADGDYGINLEDYTGAIVPALTVAGDLAPVDQDPATPGLQLGYDANGNLIVGGAAEPGRADRLYGSGLSDQVSAGGGDDYADGKAGDDELDGGSGSDMLSGGGGNDIAQGGTGDDLLAGDAGDDRLYAGNTRDLAAILAQEVSASGRDLLLGGAGNDLLAGDAGADALLGGAGSDVAIGGAGPDTLVGDMDAGVDRRDWVLTRSVLPGADGAQVYRLEWGAGFSSPAVSAGAPDDLYGGAGEDWIFAGGGDDYVDGGDDADVLFGDAGADDVFGGAGNDKINGDNGIDVVDAAQHGDDWLDGEAGDDLILGMGGADQIYGGDGNDRLVGDGPGLPAFAQGNDTLDGGAGDDVLQADGGNDSLAGGADDDLLFGEDGNDLLTGDGGADQLSGEAGDDLLDGGDGVDMLSGGEGNDSLDGGAGDDSTALAGGLDGGAGNDFLDGGAGNDELQGGEGNDSLAGAEGDDLLFGGAGDDSLHGGAGNDQLEAGGGRDTLTGGAGTDTLFDLAGGATTYLFQAGDGWDQIRDAGGANRLDLSGFALGGIEVGHTGDGSTLVLDLGGGDRIDIVDGFLGAVQTFALAGGTVSLGGFLDASLPAGVGITGTGNLTGGAGADTLTATASSTLYGGRGDDALVGLAGGNTILTDPASGHDSLRVAGTDNVVVLAGATLLDLAPSWGRSDPLDLVVGLAGNRSLTVLGGAAGSVAEWRFDDGTLTHAQLLARLPALAMGTAGHDSLTGTAGADWLAGLAGNDTLAGLAGNDVLDGGSGADRLVGGPGDDRYFVDSGTDAVVEESGEGIDSIRAATSYLVPPNVEHLVLEGSGPYFTTGNALDNELVGNGAGNALSGRGGNDTLLGLAGNDSLSGGDGADALSGGDGNDTLDGNGGADRLQGGAGDDAYAVDAAGDAVVEAAGEGTDRITSSVDFTLPDGVENLTLSGSAGQGAGNDLDNALTGNAVANLLSGAGGNDTLFGGSGNDTLDGGPGADWLAGDAGDDTFLVRSGEGGKRITEAAGNGTDTVVFDVARDAAVIHRRVDLAWLEVLLPATGETIEVSADGVEFLRFTDATVAAASIPVVIEGGAGADALTGTARSDSILGWGGDDSVYGSGGHDSLDGGAGGDRLWGNDGDDSLAGGEGNDSLEGGYGYNALYGGPGNDELRGWADPDTANGGPGDDTVYGLDGNDTLTGGGGRDVLWGGLGSDTYDYRAGDGLVTLRDATHLSHGASFGDRPGRKDVLVVAADAGHGTRYLAGIYATPTLVLQGRAGDTIRFELSDSVWGIAPVINEIRFLADGSVWSAGSAFAPGSYTRVMTDTVLGGTDLADTLGSIPGMSATFIGGAGADLYRVANPADRVWDTGNDGNIDRVEAAVDFAVEPGIEELVLTGAAVSGRGAWNDNLIVGNAGDNLLAGGGGNDTLQGGAGGDTYVVDRADSPAGTSRIIESPADPGQDVLRFTGGIGPEDVGLVRRGDDLLFVTERQRIAVAGAFPAAGPLLEAVAFSDGMVWEGDALIARTRGAPVLNLPLPDREVDEDVLSEFFVDPASFTAASGAGPVSYSASLADGSPLPDWLSFDPRRVRFSALPFDGEAGASVALRLTARDAAGNAGWETFRLTVRGTHDAPRLVAPQAVQEVAGGSPAEIGLGGQFEDPDGDALVIGVSRADGSPLPSWMALDPWRPGVLVTAPAADEGPHLLRVTATDPQGASVSEMVNLVVRYGSEPSLVVCPSGEQRVAEDSAFFFNCDPSPDLALEPGERLHVSVRRIDGGPLPAWLALDPTQTYGGGTPRNGDVGKVDLVVTATLAARGEVQTSYLSVIVENAPDAPVPAAPLPDVRVELGAAWDWPVPAASFQDVDAGDRLRLSATLADGSPLPGWLYFDGPAGRFQGTPAAAGEWTVRVTARDLSGLAASDTFVLRAEPSPARLLVGTAGGDTLEGALGQDTLAGGGGADLLRGGGGNDLLRVSADGVWPSASLVHPLTGRSIALGGRPAGFDVLDGGEGTDTAEGTGGDDILVLDEGRNPNPAGDAPRLASVERFLLGGGDDVLILASPRWTYGDVSVSGGDGIDVVWSGAGNDSIDGGAGNDLLDGGPGADLLVGGPGNDIITAEPGDTVLEHPGEGVDTIRAYASLALGPNLENLTLMGSTAIDGTGNGQDNLIIGNAAPNVLAGGAGNDTYVVGPGDTVVEGPDGGIDGIESPLTWTLPEGVERLLLTGTAPVDGYGNSVSNRLTGNDAANLLAGGDGADSLLGRGGNDLLLGLASNDLLYGGPGRNALDGGEGKDTLTGEDGNEFFLGGRGADRIVTGGGRDVVAFNAGDGQDTVLAGGAGATLSLGGGIAYADLWFRVSGSDLVVETGGTDRLTLAGWYAAAPVRGVDRLQLMVAAMGAWDAGSADPLVNRPVAAFDFAQLAARFDAARTADPALGRWPAMTALLDAYRDGWDGAAVGGDLAWRYSREGTLAGIGKAGAGSVLAETDFGIGPQALLAPAALAAGTPAWR